MPGISDKEEHEQSLQGRQSVLQWETIVKTMPSKGKYHDRVHVGIPCTMDIYEVCHTGVAWNPRVSILGRPSRTTPVSNTLKVHGFLELNVGSLASVYFQKRSL